MHPSEPLPEVGVPVGAEDVVEVAVLVVAVVVVVVLRPEWTRLPRAAAKFGETSVFP